jgi:hypothetical protein
MSVCCTKLTLEREHIEQVFGEKLDWERLDTKRASRIALYHPGNIMDDQDKFKALENWTVEMLPRFYEAIFDRACRILEHYS